MPKPSYHRQEEIATCEQGAEDQRWRQEVGSRLPPDLGEKAKQLHAFERVRGISDPLDLLRGLLAYVLCAQASSFRGSPSGRIETP